MTILPREKRKRSNKNRTKKQMHLIVSRKTSVINTKLPTTMLRKKKRVYDEQIDVILGK
jgi:hypothetical protein